MGAIGGMLRAFGDKNPELGVSSAVKNPDLARKLKATTKDYEKYKEQAGTGYENFLRQFNLQEPQAQGFGQQELGELNKIYDTGAGSLQRELERLRMERDQARETGLQRGFQFALGNLNRSRLMRDAGGPSSYDRASLTKSAADLAIQSLLERNAQERADFGYLTNLRQGGVGQRAGLLDTLANRSFIPSTTRQNLLNTDMGFLQNLMNLDQLNTFYAPYKKRTGTEAWAQGFDAIDQAIMNAASIVGSIYGMGGGGGTSIGGGAGGSFAAPNSAFGGGTGFMQGTGYAPSSGMGTGWNPMGGWQGFSTSMYG